MISIKRSEASPFSRYYPQVREPNLLDKIRNRFVEITTTRTEPPVSPEIARYYPQMQQNSPTPKKEVKPVTASLPWYKNPKTDAMILLASVVIGVAAYRFFTQGISRGPALDLDPPTPIAQPGFSGTPSSNIPSPTVPLLETESQASEGGPDTSMLERGSQEKYDRDSLKWQQTDERFADFLQQT